MSRGHATLAGARLLFFIVFLFPITSWGFLGLTPKKIEYELSGMPYRQQPPGFDWCWASSLQMVQSYKYRKRINLCEIASEHLNQACCVGIPQSCNKRAYIDEVTSDLGESGKHITASVEETNIYLKQGKSVILSLLRKDGLHYAVLQAKYADNKGYRIFDPRNGILDVSDKQMRSRRLYRGYTWIGSFVVY